MTYIRQTGLMTLSLAWTTRRAAAYSISKCITILMLDEDMTELDAVEWFYFNVAGSEFGEGTPIWIDDTYEHNY